MGRTCKKWQCSQLAVCCHPGYLQPKIIGQYSALVGYFLQELDKHYVNSVDKNNFALAKNRYYFRYNLNNSIGSLNRVESFVPVYLV